MKLYFFTKYTEKGASSRYRIYQYLPYFNEYDVKISPFFDDSYKLAQSFKSIKGLLFLIKSYIIRLFTLLMVNNNDIVIVQYEFTQYLPFIKFYFKWRNIKYIIDFDDAVFHDYDQHKNGLIRTIFKNKIPSLIKSASAVITGSPYLTEYIKQYNTNVYEIPTSINIEKYTTKVDRNNSSKLIIGWIGSSTTSLHLKLVVEPLMNLVKQGLDFELRLIGYDEKEGIDFKEIPIRYIKWSSENEALELSKFTVGIMPLIDFPFARGKCAFKLIQYMACGIPTISTPFEANLKVDRNNENLFADNSKEWVNSLLKIKKNKERYNKIGIRNKSVIQKYYSIQENHRTYLNIFENINIM